MSGIETIVVDGLALAKEIRAELAVAVAAHVASGRRPPKLAVVLVGEDPASASYIKGKRRACQSVGMESVECNLPASASQAEILGSVESLNADPGVDGILVQLPLPDGIDANLVTGAVRPDKDVDGLRPENAGRLLLGMWRGGPRPCIPLTRDSNI